jgi:hypothetical protein
MKFNIKALLMGAALIAATQGNVFAMSRQATNEGVKYSEWPQFTSKNAVFSGGKLVAYGWVNQAGRKYAAIARINSDGTADRTFGNNGLVIINTANPSSEVRGLSFNADGSIRVRLNAPHEANHQVDISAAGQQSNIELE